jgi:hypothetical protein
MNEKRSLCTRFSGFNDFFVPVLKAGKCIAFIVSGYFLKNVPTRRELELQWESWTGQNADFSRTPPGLPNSRWNKKGLDRRLSDIYPIRWDIRRALSGLFRG